MKDQPARRARAPSTPVPRLSKRGAGTRPPAVFPRAVPTLLAAAVVAVLLVSVPVGIRVVDGPAFATAAPPAAVAAPAPPAHAPTAPTPPVTTPPVTTTYVVKPGDSLWKIFTSVRPQKPDHRGWMDFLANTRSANSLDNPDRLQPGKVLTITVHPE